MADKIYKVRDKDTPWGMLAVRPLNFFLPSPEGSDPGCAEAKQFVEWQKKYSTQGFLTEKEFLEMHGAYKTMLDVSKLLEFMPPKRKAVYDIDQATFTTSNEVEEIKPEEEKKAKEKIPMPKPKAPVAPVGETPEDKVKREYEEKMKKLNEEKDALDKKQEELAEALAKEEKRLDLHRQLKDIEGMPAKKGGMLATIGGPATPFLMVVVGMLYALFRMFSPPKRDKTRKKQKRSQATHTTCTVKEKVEVPVEEMA